jgi:hypothetical protein
VAANRLSTGTDWCVCAGGRVETELEVVVVVGGGG